MRGDVQAIFKMCPRSKQVMMFTATLPGSMQDICKKFMNKVRQAACKRAAGSDSTALLGPSMQHILGRGFPFREISNSGLSWGVS